MELFQGIKNLFTPSESKSEAKPTEVDLVAPMKSVKKEVYKAPEFIFPKRDPAKQENLDALIQAISSFQTKDEDEDGELNDETKKKFQKILKLLGK
jgi:hypothetical protein